MIKWRVINSTACIVKDHLTTKNIIVLQWPVNSPVVVNAFKKLIQVAGWSGISIEALHTVRPDTFDGVDVWGVDWPLQHYDIFCGEMVFDNASGVYTGVAVCKRPDLYCEDCVCLIKSEL